MGIRFGLFALVLVAFVLTSCGGSEKPAGTCTADCEAECVDPIVDCGAPPACRTATCTADQTCANVADASQDGANCGSGLVCSSGACVAPPSPCGNGVLDGTEACDFGADNGNNAGCEVDCTLSCSMSSGACDDTDPCNGVETCSMVTVSGHAGQKCVAGTAQADGVSCGTGRICVNAACAIAVCGDGVTTGSEECDDANQTMGDGCDNACRFSCLSTDPIRNCTPADACAGQGVCNDATHTCSPGTPLSDDSACGAGRYCATGVCTQPVCGNGNPEPGEACDDGALNGTTGSVCKLDCTVCASPPCINSTCGDGVVDATVGESCEPPGTSTCDAMCRVIQCGDGVRAGTEQCDDGGTANLDGCDGGCRFEQSHRINSLALSFTTSAYCPTNALGGAITGSNARNNLTAATVAGIADGSITVLFHALDLDDLTGTTDPTLRLGVLGGRPAVGTTTYNGANDLDWWYPIDVATIDAMRVPTTVVPASIAAKVLDAGPANFSFGVNFVGTPVRMELLAGRFRGTIGATTTPLMSAGTTPGHLAAEQLDPALVSYATMTGAQMCGNTTANSLATVSAPSSLIGCGFGKCTQCYTTANTLLDIVVSGCDVALVGQQVKATQPDTARVPGDVYRFTANTTRVITSCTKNNVATTLQDCFTNAAYTTLYDFATGRVIAK